MVCKRGKYYYFNFQVKLNRRRESTGLTDREQAERLERREKLAAKARLRGEAPLCTLREMVDLWLKLYRADYSANYVATVERFGRMHLYELADLPMDGLTTFKVQQARTQYLLEGHGFHSANAWLRILKMLCRKAVDLKMMEAVSWKVTMLNAQTPPRPILPLGLTRAWLQAVDEQGKPAASMAVRLMLGLGLRETEAYSARWEWLNLEEGIYQPGRTKNRNAEKLRVRPSLLAYLRPLAERKGPMCWLAVGRTPYRGYCRRIMQKANEAIGLEGITPHRLRGTLATMLLRKLPPLEAQEALRHKRVGTTLIYQTKDMRLLDQAYEELDREMGMTG